MKANLAVGSAALLALSAGCAGTNAPRLLDPIGPDPVSQPSRSAAGFLRVFSAFDVHANFSESDAGRRRHSDYWLSASAGDSKWKIHNDTRSSAEGPLSVELTPGRYRVVARANGYGWVSVPVVVSAGQITVVHLEGGWHRAAAPGAPDGMVHLPAGEWVGPRARDEAAQ